MDEALRNLIIGLILLAIAGAGYVTALLKARTSLVGKFQEAELKRQEQNNLEREQASRERKALLDTLEGYRSDFARERVEREALQKRFDELETKYDADQKRITVLEEDKRQSDKTIERLNGQVKEQAEQIRKLTDDAQQEKARYEALLKTANEATKTEHDRAEQYKTDFEVERRRMNEKIEGLQKRVEELSTKTDTGQLDAVKVPDAAPETASADGATLSEVDAKE